MTAGSASPSGTFPRYPVYEYSDPMLVENADGHRLVEIIDLPEQQLPTLCPLAVSLVLARQGGNTLLVFNRQKHYWELPGGMIDEGETARDCAAREFVEETSQPCGAGQLTFVGALRFQLRSQAAQTAHRIEFGALFATTVHTPRAFVESPEVSAIHWWDGRADIGHIDAIDRWLACQVVGT